MQSTTPDSIADGIAVGNPVSGVRAIRDVVRSGGSFVSVSDAQMLDAMRLLSTRAGILAEPAGAAALAGALVALMDGLVGPEEQIAVLVTGSSLKTPQFLRPHGRVVEIAADLDVLRKLLPGPAHSVGQPVGGLTCKEVQPSPGAH